MTERPMTEDLVEIVARAMAERRVNLHPDGFRQAARRALTGGETPSGVDQKP